MDETREQLPVVSPSLLPPPTWKEKYQFNPKFDLGIGEWMGEGPNTMSSDYPGTLAAEPEATVKDSSILGRDRDKESENIPPGALQESRKRKCLSLKKDSEVKKKRIVLEPSERFSTTNQPNIQIIHYVLLLSPECLLHQSLRN